MFLVGVHPIRDIRQSQSQDAESQLNAKSQEVGTLSAKAEAKTGKQQALLPGAAGMVLCGQHIAQKNGEILNLELISERFGVSSFDVTFVAGKCFIDLIQSKMSRKLKFISQISETGRCWGWDGTNVGNQVLLNRPSGGGFNPTHLMGMVNTSLLKIKKKRLSFWKNTVFQMSTPNFP